MYSVSGDEQVYYLTNKTTSTPDIPPLLTSTHSSLIPHETRLFAFLSLSRLRSRNLDVNSVGI